MHKDFKASLWVLLSPNGSLCVLIDPYAFFLVFICPYRLLCVLMESNGLGLRMLIAYLLHKRYICHS